MASWLDGFYDNAWLKLVRYNPTTQRFYSGATNLAPTRSVADWAALQAIPQVIENDKLIVYVESFPKHKSIFVYDHASTEWYLVNGRIGGACDSIMYIGDQNTQGGNAGFHPLMPYKVPYYSNTITFTNINSGGKIFIRSFRGGPGCSTAGAGTMRFEKSTKKLYWAAYNGTGIDPEGPGVDVSIGGWYRLESGVANVGRDCVVTIKPGSHEPSADAIDNVTVSGNKEISAHLHTLPAMINAVHGSPFAGNEKIFAMNALDAQLAWDTRSQWGGELTDITIIQCLDGSTRSSISYADTAIANLINVVKKRQAVGSRVIVVLPSINNNSSDASITYLPYVSRKVKSLADTYGFEVVDINRYLADPAGTISNPGLAAMFNSLDATYYSVLGMHMLEKYGLTPALSKYLPSKLKPDWDIVPYSATETFGNLLTNGRLTGTAGTKGARVTGDVPTSYSLTLSGGTALTAVCTSPDSASPVARGEGYPGNVFQVVLDNTTGVDNEAMLFTQTTAISSSNYAAGDTVRLSAELTISAGGAGINQIHMYISDTGNRGYAFSNYSPFNTVSTLNGDTIKFQIASTPIVLQPGVANLNIIFVVNMKAGGTATVKLSPGLRISKVTY